LRSWACRGGGQSIGFASGGVGGGGGGSGDGGGERGVMAKTDSFQFFGYSRTWFSFPVGYD